MRDSSTLTSERVVDSHTLDLDSTTVYIILALSCLPYVLICTIRRFRIILCFIYFCLQYRIIVGFIYIFLQFRIMYLIMRGASIFDIDGLPHTLNPPFSWQVFFIISALFFLPYVLICTSTTRFRRILCLIYFIIHVHLYLIGHK